MQRDNVRGPLLLVVEMQEKYRPHCPSTVIDNVRTLIQFWVTNDWPVLWSRYAMFLKAEYGMENHADESSINRLLRQQARMRELHADYPALCVDDDKLERTLWGHGQEQWNLMSEIDPMNFGMDAKEVILDSHLWNVFTNPTFLDTLSRMNDHRLFLVGGFTDVCIQSNAALALNYNRVPFVVTDAVYSETEEHSRNVISVLRDTYVVIKTKNILDQAY